MRTAALVGLLLVAPLLAEDPPPDQIKEWIHALHSRYFSDREDAKKQLVNAGKAAEDALVAALGDDDFRVRVAAIDVLGRLKSAKAIPRLVELLVDPDAEIASEAGKALHAIGAEARAAVEARRKADASFDAKAAAALRAWTEEDVERALDSLMTPDGGWGFFEGQYRKVVALGPAAVPVLVAMFTDPAYEFHTLADDEARRSTVRILAGEALAEVEDSSFVPRLKACLDGEVKEAREVWGDGHTLGEEAAAYALWMHGEKQYLSGLERTWQAQVRGGRASRHRLAFVLIRQQKYAEAEKVYQQEIAENPGDSAAVFNLATVYGKQGKKELALSTLKEAVRKGYDSVEWLKRDGYLQCIRGTPEYEGIVKELEGKSGKEEGSQPQ